MKIIISPAKTMHLDNDFLDWQDLPFFLEEATTIKDHLQQYTYDELKAIWQCNDKIATLNEQRIKNMNLTKNLTPALLSYEGLQYQSMAPHVFTQKQWDYVGDHLIILSGFYGMLKPLDGITPYRLEMQAKLPVGDSQHLYDFWASKLYEKLTEDHRVVLNLASKEYSKTISKYVQPDVRFVTVEFKQWVDGKLKTRATEAKQARGEMVRWLAEHEVKTLEGVTNFNSMHYTFSAEYSTDSTYTFIKEVGVNQ